MVIDPDPKIVEAFRSDYESPILQGVADDEEILKKAGIERAAGVVVALPNDRDTLVTTLSIRMLNPSIRIVVKEIEPGMAARLRRAGADAVVNPGTIGGLRLVSELVRPSVVMFLDTMLRDKASSYRFEELLIPEKCAWANKRLGDIPARSEFGLFLVGARRMGQDNFAYNPEDSLVGRARTDSRRSGRRVRREARKSGTAIRASMTHGSFVRRRASVRKVGKHGVGSGHDCAAARRPPVCGVADIAGRAARVRLPYTVVLVIFGFGLRTIFSDWEGFEFLQSEIATEVVFFIFLPTLLFESSFNLDSKVLFRNIVPVLTLAIPAFLLSTAIVGYLGAWALGIPLVTALLFGALISATDPVAVVALFKELGAPKRLMILVEGESLFNDATAIVLFNVLLGLAVGGAAATLSVSSAIIDFLTVFTGGIAVGAVLAFTFAQILSFVRNDELVEITLTTIGAYMSFIVAEHYLGVSGVMATATAGMILGGWGRTKISPKVGHFMHSFWEYLAFIANSLIFLLVGLALSLELIEEFLVPVLLVIPIVYFARAVSVAGAVPMVNATKLIEPIDRRHQAVMYWGGLRGALALALALSLPPEFAARELILVSAMGVVMATLLVNALTIGPLLRVLGFDRLSPAEMFARFESLLILKRETRDRVAKFAEEKAIAPAIVQQVQQDYLSGEARLEAEREAWLAGGGELSQSDRMQVLANQALRAEKKHYWEEFYEGTTCRVKPGWRPNVRPGWGAAVNSVNRTGCRCSRTRH